jgi:hypothetical protein
MVWRLRVMDAAGAGVRKAELFCCRLRGWDVHGWGWAKLGMRSLSRLSRQAAVHSNSDSARRRGCRRRDGWDVRRFAVKFDR